MKYSIYAQRFLKDTGTVQLMDDLGSAPAGSLMLGGGNPAHIPAAEKIFREAMHDILAEQGEFSRMVGDYSGAQGYSAFVVLLADYFREEFGWNIGPSNIALTNGSQASFSVLFNSFAGRMQTGENKKILLPLVPEYIGYTDQNIDGVELLESRRPVIDKRESGRFKYRIDFDALEVDQSHGAICLSRPTNPSGNVVSDQDLHRLAGIAQSHDIPIIVDGAYGLPFPGIVYNSAQPWWSENCVLCLSLSKLGLPGVRTGIVVANEEITSLIRRANAINTLAPGNVGPYLGARLIKERAMQRLCESEISPYYLEKRDFALSAIAEHMAGLPVRVHEPEGAFFLWLWFEGLPGGSSRLYADLRNDQVYVIDGENFFQGLSNTLGSWKHRHECIRVSYAGERKVIEQGIKAIANKVLALYDA